MKAAVIGLLILGPVTAWLAFGKRGFVQLYRMETERQDSVAKIRQLAEENQALMDEISRFRTDMTYVESVARRELGLIRENEVVYRFEKDGSKKGTTTSTSRKTEDGGKRE